MIGTAAAKMLADFSAAFVEFDEALTIVAANCKIGIAADKCL